MLTGKQLRALFQQFNGQYFNGRLPAYALRSVERSTWLGESGCCYKKRKLINISRGLSDEEATSTLLHEIAHAATNDGHGMAWKKEMIRLREAGAPFVSGDLDVDLSDWDGKKVSRQHFRREIQNVLLDLPDITLTGAIRLFISNVGGAASVAEFLRRCPWAASVFKDENRAAEEYKRLRADFLARRARG